MAPGLLRSSTACTRTYCLNRVFKYKQLGGKIERTGCARARRWPARRSSGSSAASLSVFFMCAYAAYGRDLVRMYVHIWKVRICQPPIRTHPRVGHRKAEDGHLEGVRAEHVVARGEGQLFCLGFRDGGCEVIGCVIGRCGLRRSPKHPQTRPQRHINKYPHML